MSAVQSKRPMPSKRPVPNKQQMPGKRPISALELKQPVEKRIAGVQVHSYQVKLEAEEFVRVMVEQIGVDVILLWYGPDGNKLFESDTPTGTQDFERILWVADSPGNYRLDIRPLEKDAKAGAYRAEMVELREATINDLRRLNNRRILNSQLVAGKPEVLVGRDAPPVLLTDLNGKIYDLKNQGDKVIVINFWATWCIPCLIEMPAVQKLHDSLQKNGVLVLGISDEEPLLISKFVHKHGIKFPMVNDSYLDATVNYKIRALPTTFIINPDGKIVFAHQGMMEEEELFAAVNGVLSKKR